MAGTDNGLDPMNDPRLDNPESVVDTPAPQSTPPADNSGNGGQSVNTPAPVEQPQEPVINETDPAKIQAALREYGKLQQVQKEYADAQEKLKRLEVIENRAAESPDKFKRALVDFSGWSEQDADAYVEVLKRQGVWNQQQQSPQQPGQSVQGATPQPTQPTAPNVDPYTAAQQVYQEMQYAHQVQTEFFSRVPELDPKNIAPEKLPAMKALATAVESEAQRRASVNRTSFVDEAVNVYKEITGRTDEQLAQIRQEARTEGYLDANATRAASAPASPKGISPAETSHGLSAEEIAQAKAEGYTPEEWSKLKDPISTVE